MKRNKKTQETNKMVLPDYTCGPSIQDFSMEWRTVELAVRDILKMQPVSRKNWMLSIEVIFYELVVSPNYEFLQLAYDRIQIIFEAHVKECAQRIERSPAGNLLNDYYDIWNNFDDACKKLQALFFSLNSELRSIKYDDADLNDESFMEIQNLALNLWMTEVLKPDLAKKIVRLLLDAFMDTEDRRALLSNQNKLVVVQTVIQSISRVSESSAKEYEGCKFYKETFENPFLEKLKEHYRCEASKMLQELSIPQYIEKVVAKLDEESKWSAIIIPNRSTVYVKNVFMEHFVQNSSMDQILSEGVRMIEEERVDDHDDFYKILKEILQRGKLAIIH